MGVSITGAAGYYIWGLEGGLAFFVSGTLSVYLLSPDLDLEISRASRRWGFLNPVLWGLYRLFHKHRGSSHTYIYGPLSRLLFLLPLVYAVDWLLRLSGSGLSSVLLRLSSAFSFSGSSPAIWLCASGGYLVGQWLHLIQDSIPLKRLFW